MKYYLWRCISVKLLIKKKEKDDKQNQFSGSPPGATRERGGTGAGKLLVMLHFLNWLVSTKLSIYHYLLYLTQVLYILFGYYSVFNLKREKKNHLLMLPNSQKWIFRKCNMFSVMLFSSVWHRADEMGHVSKTVSGEDREAIKWKQKQKWEAPLWQAALWRQGWCENLNLGTLVAA